MDMIHHIKLEPLAKSKFLKPRRVYYEQNRRKRQVDCIVEHSDVEILIYNSSRNVLVFVKQFRPAVHFSSSKCELRDGQEVIDTHSFPPSLGITFELCAGIVDKAASLEEIAKAEVLEECGYDVPLESLKRVTSFRNGSTLSGVMVNLFYAEVTDSQKVSSGGGLESEGEMIEVIELSIPESRRLMYDEFTNRAMSLIIALQWFFQNIWKEEVL